MKRFFSIFQDSARELSDIRTITVGGMLMAVAIVLRALAIPITSDIRVTLSFLGILMMAYLYGPVLSMLGYIGVDIIGYILDGSKMRDYNFALLAVKIFEGLVYGLIVYQQHTGRSIKLTLVRAVIAHLIVVIIGHLIMNSSVLYYCYYNTRFPFLTSSEEWLAFKTWFSARLLKNAILFPAECILMIVLVPAIDKAYYLVFPNKKAQLANGSE